MNGAARIAFLSAMSFAVVLAASTAKARHGGSSLLSSPGYQARLAESRKAYTDAYYAAQRTQSPAPHRHKRRPPPAN